MAANLNSTYQMVRNRFAQKKLKLGQKPSAVFLKAIASLQESASTAQSGIARRKQSLAFTFPEMSYASNISEMQKHMQTVLTSVDNEKVLVALESINTLEGQLPNTEFYKRLKTNIVNQLAVLTDLQRAENEKDKALTALNDEITGLCNHLLKPYHLLKEVLQDNNSLFYLLFRQQPSRTFHYNNQAYRVGQVSLASLFQYVDRLYVSKLIGDSDYNKIVKALQNVTDPKSHKLQLVSSQNQPKEMRSVLTWGLKNLNAHTTQTKPMATKQGQGNPDENDSQRACAA